MTQPARQLLAMGGNTTSPQPVITERCKRFSSAILAFCEAIKEECGDFHNDVSTGPSKIDTSDKMDLPNS